MPQEDVLLLTAVVTDVMGVKLENTTVIVGRNCHVFHLGSYGHIIGLDFG